MVDFPASYDPGISARYVAVAMRPRPSSVGWPVYHRWDPGDGDLSDPPAAVVAIHVAMGVGCLG